MRVVYEPFLEKSIFDIIFLKMSIFENGSFDVLVNISGLWVKFEIPEYPITFPSVIYSA